MKGNVIIISGFFLLVGLAGMSANAKAEEENHLLNYINAIKACAELTDEQAIKACEKKAKEDHQ